MRKKLSIILTAALVISCAFGNICVNNITNVHKVEASDSKVAPYLDMGELEGFASVAAEGLDGTTGGNMGEIVTVTNTAEFVKAVSDDIPRIVVVSGNVISMTSGEKQKGGYAIDIGSNKTIVGADENAELYGGINIKNKSNIIVSNLNIHGVWPYTGPSDTVNIEGSHHIWLNHLNVWNSKDGSIDTKVGSDYITVSWCKLWYEDVVCEWDTTDGTQGNRKYSKGDTAYAKDHGHRLNCLVSSGAGDHEATDMGKLHVTFHHNWFADNVNERMPRVMYGRAHVYNNLYTCSGNLYCTGVDCYASVLLENNYYDGVRSPHVFSYPQNPQGACITARGNKYVNTSGSKDNGQKNSMTVTPFTNTVYDYYLNEADDIADIVKGYAGPQSKSEAAPAKGTLVEGVNITEGKVEATPLPAPTAVPKSTDNPVTYDKSSDTYTYHGQNKDGSNGFTTITNPFAGKDFSETPEYSGGYPVWKKGVTIGYWVKLPSTANDASVLTFQLENSRQLERGSKALYNTCVNYSPSDTRYSLGTHSIYVDANGKEYNVLSDYGSLVCYNPYYPVEGCYEATSNGGAVYAYKKGSDPSKLSNWLYLNYIGEGKYSKYGYRFDEEGGDDSQLQEANVTGSFCLYASGTMGFRQDDATAVQINPNLPNYGMGITAHTFNQFFYFGNGSVYTNSNGTKTPTMASKGTWHYVVEVITNDWVQCYMDGQKLGIEYFNYFKTDLTSSKANISGESFNMGTGALYESVRTSSPADMCKTSMTLLDFISDEDTMLMVGGTGVCASILSQNGILTPDGTQVKNFEFYDVPVASSNITATGITIDKDKVEIAPSRTAAPERTPLATTQTVIPSITTAPGGSTTKPGVTTTPGGSTTKPGETTITPGGSTTKPGETPTPPGEDTPKPGETPTEPGENTTKPGETPTPPGGSTTKPGETPTPPGENTTKPGETPTPPGGSTTKPGVTTTEPGEDTTKPGVTTTEPGEDTTKPGETTTKPGENTTKPGETTTEPGENTTKPGETTTKPGGSLTNDVMKGDVTGDKKVNLLDAKEVLKYSLGIIKVPSELVRMAADVNEDKKVDLNDAKSVLKYSLGIINQFPETK